jgi:hypothetical protein
MKWFLLCAAVLVSGCSKSEAKKHPAIYAVDAGGNVHQHKDYPADESREELIDELEDSRAKRNADQPSRDIGGGASVSLYEFSPEYDETTTSNLRYLVWKKRQSER